MDLYRLLSEHPPAVLRAIAANWQVELEDQDPLQAARQLGDAMLAPGALVARITALSPEARQALSVLAQSHGQAAMKSLTLRYGDMRRVGPGRLERDRPWDETPSPLEELVYNGLAFRAFGAVPGGHGELLLLPGELLERLPPPTRAAPAMDLALAPEPALVADAGLALSEDVLAVLSYLRRVQPAAPPDDDHLQPPAWLMTDQHLARRLIGARDEARLALCWRLLWRLNLIEEKHGRLRPSLAARDWLRSADVSRATRLYRAWRDDPRVAELEQVSALICDPDGCPYDPVASRRRLMQFVQELQPGSWHTPESLAQALKRSQPTFLRPDGDLTSWFVRDAITGQYLRGIESWERVEAALALYLLTHQLHWLGLVRLGAPGPDSAPTALGLTDLGTAMLGKATAREAGRDAALAQANAQGDVHVALRGSAYERYQLERIAFWQGQQEVAHYLLTEESIWEGYNAGITVEQMLAFLKRITGAGLPTDLTLTLQTWARRFGRATLRQATLLMLADEGTAREIARDHQLSALIVETLTPTVLVVRANDVDELTAALKARGIWPQKETDSP
jgi:hypothetical protein